MIKILIVDDSKAIQEFLDDLLSSDPDLQVVGFANPGKEAVEVVRIKKPDLIIIGASIHGIDGYEAVLAIMETIPTPIVIVSESENMKEAANAQKYMKAGALAIVIRPAPFELHLFTSFRNELIQTVKLMSEIKVIKQFKQNRKDQITTVLPVELFDNDINRIKVIAIGASTGGPNALQVILSRLPADLTVPVLIVQHITPGFVKMFQKMLSSTSGIRLKIAEEGEKISAGIGYIAPDNFHMGVTTGHRIILSNQPPENGSKPSVSFLFRSVAQTFGPNSLGVLLTGMGRDGADELKDMRNKGALTVVQNEESSVVFGMPGEALRIGASNNALSPEGIAQMLSKSGSKKTGHGQSK